MQCREAAPQIQDVLGAYLDAVVANDWLSHAAVDVDTPQAGDAAGRLAQLFNDESGDLRRISNRHWKQVRRVHKRI